MKPENKRLQQAADWYALLNAEEASDTDRGRWQDWLDQHPENRRAWGYVEKVSKQFDRLRSEPFKAQTGSILDKSGHDRRRLLRNLVVVSGLAVGSGVVWRSDWAQTHWLRWHAEYATPVGRIRTVNLPDDSRLRLNTRSAINTHYTAVERRIDLLDGEIWVDTAKDSRPFVITSREIRLQALGTRFTVSRQSGAMHLSVYDGAVDVSLDSRRAVVNAGQRADIASSTGIRVSALADSDADWIDGVLVADNLTLSDWVARMAPYRQGHISLNPAVADLRVMGVFPLQDSDKALDMLTKALPVRVSTPVRWWVRIDPLSAP